MNGWVPAVAVRAAGGRTAADAEIRERGKNWSVEFKHPQIDGAPLFNEAVRAAVDPIVREFRKEMPAEINRDFGPGTLEGKYTARTLRSGVVSVLLEWSEYYPGAAHPGSSMASVNYDARAGRVLALGDLLRPGVDYVTRLSELAVAALVKEGLGNAETIRHGANPQADSFKVFTLTDRSLVLHFPVYQVAAYAASPQKVEIPLATLAPLLPQR